jgi:hypothetical protein
MIQYPSKFERFYKNLVQFHRTFIYALYTLDALMDETGFLGAYLLSGGVGFSPPALPEEMKQGS